MMAALGQRLTTLVSRELVLFPFSQKKKKKTVSRKHRQYL